MTEEIADQEGKAAPRPAPGAKGLAAHTPGWYRTSRTALRDFVIVSVAAAVVLALALALEVSHTIAGWTPEPGGWEIGEIIVLAILPAAFGIFSWRRWTQVREELTARRRAEEALRESEKRYRDLVEDINDVIFEVDATGRMTYISPAVEGPSGYTPSDIVGRYFTDFLHPDDVPALAKSFARGLSGDPEPSEYRLWSKSGEILWARSFSRPIFEGDRIVGLRGVLTDITERKRAEEALRESEGRFRGLSDAAADGILIARGDRAVEIVEANPRLAEMFGYQPSELIGKTPSDMFTPDSAALILRNIKSGYEKPYELTGVKKDGTVFPVEAVGKNCLYQGARARVTALRDITERKRAEEALRESEARFRNTLDSMLEGCQIIGFDWRYLYVNDAVARHGRRAKEELLGHTMMEMYPGIEDTEMFGYLQRCMEQRVPDRMENEFTYPDGEKAWFELSIQPVPEGIFILSLDITQRRRAEEALRESEERYRDLYEHAPDMFASVDPRTARILRCNKTLATALGYTKEEIIGRPVFEIYHPDCMEDVNKAFRSFVETGEVRGAELQLRRKDGTKIDVTVNVSAVRDEDGKILYSRTILRDITERKRAEEALRQSEEKLRSLMQSANDAIITADGNGNIVSWNKGAQRVFGYEEGEALGKPLTLLIPERHRGAHRRALARVRSTGETRIIGKTVDLEGLRKDGSELPLETSLSSWKAGQETFYGAIIRDITERRRMEEALKAAREELEAKVEHQMLRRNPYGLTFRELTLLHLVAAGESDRQIGITLGISPLTAQKHISNILTKMEAASRTEAGVRAVREGLLD